MTPSVDRDPHAWVLTSATSSAPLPAASSSPTSAVEIPAVDVVTPDPQPLDRHAALTYLADLSAGSRRVIQHRLDEIASSVLPGATHETFPWHRLQPSHVTALRSMLNERYAPATARQAMSALRRVLRQCWRFQYYDFDHYSRLIDVRPIEGTSERAGRAITRAEFLALMDACDSSRPAHLRDRAALALMLGAGFRRSEAARADLADYDPTQRRMLVHAKRKRDHWIPLVQWAKLMLDAWIATRGTEPGPLLHEVRPNGTIVRARLSGTAIYQQLARVIDRAGVARLSPHDLRRTFGTAILDETQDLASVQLLLGHASPATTQRGYDRRGEYAARAAVDTLENWGRRPPE